MEKFKSAVAKFTSECEILARLRRAAGYKIRFLYDY